MQQPRLNLKWIDPRALDIIKRLQEKGYSTYLVGGCVRDLLLGIYPKDFDVVTSARPRQIKQLISDSYVIGRRFRLVLVNRGRDQFEVSTFRRGPSVSDKLQNKADHKKPDFLKNNLFGTPKEDACRRDFTINSLFYDPIQEKIIDYCDGLRDIRSRTIRMIGDPYERIPEDPIRILRSLRLAHKLQFLIDPLLRQAIASLAKSICLSVLPRRREEMLKILSLDSPDMVFQEIYDLKVMKHAWPQLNAVLEAHESAHIFWNYAHFISEIRSEHQSPQRAAAKPNPLNLFSLLILSLSVAQNIYDPLKIVAPGTYVFHSELTSLMKDELGMSRWEINEVLRALELLPRLKGQYEVFKTWQVKRQTKFLSQKGFSIAILFASIEQTLPHWEIASWITAYQKVHPNQLTF